VHVTDDGRTRQQIQVTGARPDRPFWLVLGESYSRGWEADGDAAVPAGSTLVDGYANGWQVTPSQASFGLTLRWTPQTWVWIGLAVSAVTILVCVGLIVWRRRRRHVDAVGAAAFDGPVSFASPAARGSGVVGTRAAVAGAVSAGVVGAALARWWIDVLLGGLVFAALARPRLRVVLAVGAPVSVAVVAAFVVVQQYRYRYPYEFFWVEHFDRISDVAWLAVLLLAADAFVELVRVRRRPSYPPSPDAAEHPS
jgi:hypothetical protein